MTAPPPPAVTAECYSTPQQSLQNVASYSDSIPQQSLQNVTVSLSNHCRMLQYPLAVTADCYVSLMTAPPSSHCRMLQCLDSIPQQTLQNVTVSLRRHCRMLQLPHDRPPAVAAECYLKSR